jgi:kynurenine formamidase
MRYVSLTAATIGVMAFAGVAQAACKDNWKECAGKPWVDGTVMETPMGSKWWPNKLWGADDEAGSTNWFAKPEVVLRALSQVKEGKVYKIGHPYTATMPLFGDRKFVLRIPGAPTGGTFGANQLVYNDEFLATEIGQVGTQFDGLGHIGVASGGVGNKDEMRWYNGYTATEMNGAAGLKKNGIEKLHPIIARGILLDIAAARGVDSMKAGEVISMADVHKALELQGMKDFKFMEGDAIIFRTGWEKYWTDPATFNNGCPGIGMEVARWVAEDVKAGLTAGDTWPVDAVPNPDPDCVFCVPAFLQTRHGIVNHENLKLSELAKDKVYQFTYVFTPTPIAGATGSAGAPIAIR